MLAKRIVFALVLALAALALRGERLATERFTAEVGLVGERITTLEADSRGFVWIGTTEGLSRFDGAEFRNYTVRDGLPGNGITAIVEDAGGDMWIATDKGLVRLVAQHPPSAPAFQRCAGALPPGAPITAIVRGRDGLLWAAEGKALYRIDARAAQPVAVRERTLTDAAYIYALAAAPNGDLWIATTSGLRQRHPDGRIVRYNASTVDDEVRTVGVTPDGIVWIPSDGVLAFVPDEGRDPRPLVDRAAPDHILLTGQPFRRPSQPGEVMRYVRRLGVQSEGQTDAPVVTPDGTIWAATPFAVARFRAGDWSLLAEESGLSFDELTSIAVDRTGAIWLGTIGDGVLRLRPRGLVSFSTADGMLHKRVTQVFELPSRELVVASGGNRYVQTPDGLRFRGIAVGDQRRLPGWGWNQAICVDHTGDVWMATGDGLLRYPNVRTFADFATRVPIRYTEADGLGGHDVFRVFEDGRGDVWVSTFGAVTVTRFDRASGRFVRHPPQVGLPYNAATAFADDGHGGVWIGFYDGGVSLYRHGRFRYFGEDEGVPPGFVHAIVRDSRGALWIGTSRGGVAVVDDPAAERIAFRRITVRDGLASMNARAIVEASDGAMWIGSVRGVDRIDPVTRAVTHFTRNDGLANNVVTNLYRDRDGVLWVGTVEGVSALRVMPPRSELPARTLITRVVVDGVPLAVPELGTTSLGELTLSPTTRRVEIGFVAPLLQQSRKTRYSLGLLGVNDTWSDTDERAARFERLPPRRFRFEVHATADDGTVAPAASVTFAIEPPVWKRWWFVAAAIAVAAALLLTLHRLRVAHLVALERMRTRIATDLHDDFGSSLSRMSILTEVVKRQVEGEPAAAILEDIGNSARTLIGALGDNIWAIDPRIDDLHSLVARARHHASDIFEAAGIASRFEVQEGLESVRLAPADRRQVYLILKEALNNVAKHSGAKKVVVAVSVIGERMLVEIVDDGRGFDPSRVALHESGSGGRGLSSMRERAATLGGRIEVVSRAREGTTLIVELPIRGAVFARLRLGA